MTPIHSAQQLSTQMDDSTSTNANYNNSTSKDALVVLLTLSVISITLYFSYYLWKKHRHRALCASKLEDYRYSRLSQNEIDVDNMQFNNPLQSQDDCIFDPEVDDNEDKSNQSNTPPATLHIETDSTTVLKAEGKRSSILDDLSDEDLLQ